MSKDRLQLLTHDEIELKIERIAWQIYERHSDQYDLCLIGLQDKGDYIANLLADKLKKISTFSISNNTILLDKNHPLPGNAQLKKQQELRDKNIILVDDVLNSGRTMLMALLPILQLNPRTITTVVLANRSHCKFPITADIVGISLATTLQEHIEFEVHDASNKMSIWLD